MKLLVLLTISCPVILLFHTLDQKSRYVMSILSFSASTLGVHCQCRSGNLARIVLSSSETITSEFFQAIN